MRLNRLHRRNNSVTWTSHAAGRAVSRLREGDVEVMGRAGRYNGCEQGGSSRPHGSPLQSTKPSSSVQPAAGGEAARVQRASRRRPEGGPGTARMRRRVLTLLLAAGLLAAAALAALTIPAPRRPRPSTCSSRTGEVVPVTVDVPAGTRSTTSSCPAPVPRPRRRRRPPRRSRPSRPPPTTAPSSGGDAGTRTGGTSGPTLAAARPRTSQAPASRCSRTATARGELSGRLNSS